MATDTSDVPGIVVGWREMVALPALGIVAIRAKIDSGARSSALHVELAEEFTEGGAPWIRFAVQLGVPGVPEPHFSTAQIVDRRPVTDSGGHTAERVFIRTPIELAERSWPIEINLTSRRNMLFPMLLGRTAMSGRLQIDPARAFVYGEPAKVRRPRRR